MSDPFVSIQLQRDDPLPLYNSFIFTLKSNTLGTARARPKAAHSPAGRQVRVNTVTVVQAYRCLERAGWQQPV